MCPTTEINKDRGYFTDEMLNGRQLTFHPGAQRPTQDSSQNFGCCQLNGQKDTPVMFFWPSLLRLQIPNFACKQIPSIETTTQDQGG